MNPLIQFKKHNAHFRLVGVITIGISRLPILGFGFPDSPDSEVSPHDQISEMIGSMHTSRLTIDMLSPAMDRVCWSIPGDGPDETDPAFSVHLELPMQSRTALVGSSLFVNTVQTDLGFAAALTIDQLTHLAFYDVVSREHICTLGTQIQIKGRLSKYVSGPAVPVLRSVESLYLEANPDRNIEICDEDLGIIYQAFAGLM